MAAWRPAIGTYRKIFRRRDIAEASASALGQSFLTASCLLHDAEEMFEITTH
jgi:hypothetical protein